MNKSLLSAAFAAARLSLIAVMTAGIASAEDAKKPDDTKKEDAQVLEKFEVTGSRIKRVDAEPPQPVITFSMDEIEAKGYVNIGDFVQSLPFITGNTNSMYVANSFQAGATTANVRGLGAQRLLTLVDSRRATPLAQVSINSGTRSVFDFNTLPAAAIESIDFLKDGASALYGSDAISGVVNIRLKKNYNGLSTTLYYGNTLKNSGGDTGTKQFSLVAGAGSGKTHVVVALDLKMANSNFLRDYGVNNTDYSYMGTAKGLNQNSTANYPAALTLTRAQATAIGLAFPSNVAATVSSWTFVINGGVPTPNPTLASFTAGPVNPAVANSLLLGNENRFNFATIYQIYPAYDYISNYVSFEHETALGLKVFGSMSYTRNTTYFSFTPAPITFSTEGLVLPATNPYNPFGIALTTLTSRASFLPSRKTDLESTAGNFVLGVRGTIRSRWDWESAVSYGYSGVNTINRNYIRASVFQAALNGTTRATALNPFGPSDPAVLNNLLTVSTGSNKGDGLTYDASVTGKVFQLPAGDLSVAAGFEARNEKLQTNPDTAAYIATGGGAPMSGKRTVTSEFVEFTAPIYRSRELGSAEVQLAGRREHYSDFGNTSKPKLGAKIRLPDTKYLNVLLRGSYSESFQAPPLGLLYASQTVAFTGGLVQDPLRLQDPPTQLRLVQGGNPNLLPETAKVQYVGGVIESPKLKNLSLSLDFFNIRLNQFIVTPGSGFLLTAAGMAQFPNAIVRDNSLGNPGPILRIEAVPSNNPLAYQVYRGLDMGAKYALNNTRFGNFRFSVDATQILKIGTDSGLGGGFFNNSGYYNNPKWRSSGSIGWTYKDYAGSVTADRIGHFFNDGFVAAGWGENPLALISTQFRYSGFWHSTISIGANNVMNTRPPPNGRFGTLGMDTSTYGSALLGRFLFIRVRKDY